MSSLQPPITSNLPERPAPRPAAPLGVPQILWPSIEYGQRIQNRDLDHFPERDQIIERHNRGVTHKDLALMAFQAAIVQSYDHILVLDPHFDKIGVYALAPALEFSQASKIRLLTGVEYELELLELLIEYSNMNLPGSGTVEVHWKNDLDKRRFPHLHDRFAIVDGALWHFGSTVGGGHHTLTAASGPWSAAETGAKQFFEQCWNTSYA